MVKSALDWSLTHSYSHSHYHWLSLTITHSILPLYYDNSTLVNSKDVIIIEINVSFAQQLSKTNKITKILRHRKQLLASHKKGNRFGRYKYVLTCIHVFRGRFWINSPLKRRSDRSKTLTRSRLSVVCSGAQWWASTSHHHLGSSSSSSGSASTVSAQSQCLFTISIGFGCFLVSLFKPNMI